MPIVFDLFLSFMKIGLFTFGGGYAMIALIEDACVTKKKWITHDDMMNITVIAESTPGPIAVNCATFVGYRKAGIRGALAATIGVIIPSFAIIYLISMFLRNFLEIEIVANAFYGIKIAVGLLILKAAFNMIRQMKRHAFSVTVLVCATLIMLSINVFSLEITSIILMISAAVISVLIAVIKRPAGDKGGSL